MGFGAENWREKAAIVGIDNGNTHVYMGWLKDVIMSERGIKNRKKTVKTVQYISSGVVVKNSFTAWCGKGERMITPVNMTKAHALIHKSIRLDSDFKGRYHCALYWKRHEANQNVRTPPQSHRVNSSKVCFVWCCQV